MFVSRHRQADLDTLRQLTEAGQVTPVVDRTYPLTEAPRPSAACTPGRPAERSSSPSELTAA